MPLKSKGLEKYCFELWNRMMGKKNCPHLLDHLDLVHRYSKLLCHIVCIRVDVMLALVLGFYPLDPSKNLQKMAW